MDQVSDDNEEISDENGDDGSSNKCSKYQINMFQTLKSYEYVQKERQDKLRNGCNRFHKNYTSQSFLEKLNNNIQLYDNLGFLYCRIQKVDSTFLRKTLKTLFAGLEYQVLQGESMLQNRTWEFKECLPKLPKIMFVREPYGRALSGYVDKLFAPNPFYWKITGRHIVRTVRGINANDSSLSCGHDVTFPEFMKYLIISQRTLRDRDRHFYPMSEHCFPCNIKYDFIGKMETFREDVAHLLDSFNSELSVAIPIDFEKESDLNIAQDYVDQLFYFKKETEICEPFHKSLLRFWRDFQIRGIIPIEVKMPFTSEGAVNITKSEVVDKVTDIIKSIQNRTKLKEQRLEAKVEAFSQIPKDIMKEYLELYRADFELFGYPKNSSFIGNGTIPSSKKFKYFNIFD
ncbi:carbohydrate sulfotransferase 9-like [Saccostrea echinata]|uniref:carbohydrate sulfotransferase 9-like n=1 Tax=Saccostrea echinata TaxID=191078 RepID=UPI002A80F898|nr:carbohydrate sulfotransferase 9-like [Saccostrea echinata]